MSKSQGSLLVITVKNSQCINLTVTAFLKGSSTTYTLNPTAQECEYSQSVLPGEYDISMCSPTEHGNATVDIKDDEETYYVDVTASSGACP